MAIKLGNSHLKLALGSSKVKKAYLGEELVYSSGNVVTYKVDTGVTYQEEVDEGESVLSPKTFTPSKSGWTFMGWRADSTASNSTIAKKVMEDDTITLYAVFSKTVTLKLYSAGETATVFDGTCAYNNGNTNGASFTLADANVDGWTFRGWSTLSAGNATVIYAAGTSSITLKSDTTLYASWSASVTLSYNGNGNTGGSATSERKTIYADYKAEVIKASFTVKSNSFTKTGYTFVQWRQGSASGTAVSPGSTLSLATSVTLYAEWKSSTITYNPSDFATAFPNNGWTGGFSQATYTPLNLYAHSTSNEDSEGTITTGSFTPLSGSTKVKVSVNMDIWGEDISVTRTYACTCVKNGTETKKTYSYHNDNHNGYETSANPQTTTFEFDVSGATTLQIKFGVKVIDGGGNGYWVTVKISKIVFE